MNKLTCLLLLSLLLAACGTHRQPLPKDSRAPVLEWDSESGMNFKKGYASAAGELAGICVKGSVSPVTIGSPTATYQIDIVDSTAQLSESLGVSASASLDVGLYAASAKAEYVQNRETTSYAVYVIARADISGPEVTLQNVALLSPQEAPSGQDYQTLYLNDYLDFYNTCGDHYLDSAVTGASYRGVIRIEANSSDEQQSIKAELSGRYEAVSGSAAVTQAVQEIATRHSVSVQEFYTGVLPDGFASDAETLIKNATNFPALFKAQCQVASVSGSALGCLRTATFQPYGTLVVGSPPLAQVQQVQQAVQNAGTLTRYGVAYLVAANDATFAQANPWLFTDSQATLEGIASQTSQYLAQAKSLLAACSQSVANCVAPASATPPLPDPSTVARPTWIGIGAATSCRDYQLKFQAVSSQPSHTLSDGNYPLYVGNQTSRAARIWCHQMGTSAPTEYVSLPVANVSSGRNASGAAMTTNWLKLRLDPATLAVDTGDTTFTNTSGSADFLPGDGTFVTYSVAVNCSTATGGSYPSAKVDLTGTDFMVPLNAFVSLAGASFTYVDLDTTRQQVTLQTTAAPTGQNLCSYASAKEDENVVPQLTLELRSTP